MPRRRRVEYVLSCTGVLALVLIGAAGVLHRDDVLCYLQVRRLVNRQKTGVSSEESVRRDVLQKLATVVTYRVDKIRFRDALTELHMLSGVNLFLAFPPDQVFPNEAVTSRFDGERLGVVLQRLIASFSGQAAPPVCEIAIRDGVVVIFERHGNAQPPGLAFHDVGDLVNRVWTVRLLVLTQGVQLDEDNFVEVIRLLSGGATGWTGEETLALERGTKRSTLAVYADAETQADVVRALERLRRDIGMR